MQQTGTSEYTKHDIHVHVANANLKSGTFFSQGVFYIKRMEEILKGTHKRYQDPVL